MVATPAISVVAFSVVLAEAFAAVGLSTLVPSGAITLARLVKNLPALPEGETETPEERKTRLNDYIKDAKDALANSPAKGFNALLEAISESLPALDVLLPKTAKIHAEFTFEGREQATAEAGMGGELGGMVYGFTVAASVSAGYSYLYEVKSTNKITLDVDFVSVHVPL